MRGNQSKDVKLIPVALHFATGGKQKDNCGCLARHCRRKIEEKKRKDFLQNQKMGSQQSSIAANRMFNRALGIKSDTRLKPKPPRTFSQQHQQSTITRNNIICDNDICDVEEYDVKVSTVEADMSDKQKIDRKVKQTKNCYDPNLAANRMFQRALGSSIPAHQHSPSSTPEGNQNKQ